VFEEKNRDIMLTWSKQDVMLSKIPTWEVSREHNFKSVLIDEWMVWAQDRHCRYKGDTGPSAED
jgi:hypothetical protein